MTLGHLPPWRSDFYLDSPLFAPLAELAEHFRSHSQWPSLSDLQAFLEAWPDPLFTHGGQPLKIVEQAGKPSCFEEHYAPRIYSRGEIQTRTENWHDFFQYLTWFMFPKTKARINAIHIPHARQRIASGESLGRRTPVENTLSLFDEGGAVLVSSEPSLLQLVQDFRWKTLFWEQRQHLASAFECITFGHAMYEKGLVPYVGMTANTVLLHCPAAFHHWAWPQKWHWIDQQLEQILCEGKRLCQPRDLQPFPILGMPGWDPQNQQAGYYDNTRYFRPGRRAV